MSMRRPLRVRMMLHAILVAGAVVFLLPYMWLLGSSAKLDKEVQSADFTIFPKLPRPRSVSPYIDDQTFAWERPEVVDAGRWNGWMRAALEVEIGAVVDAWRESRPEAAELEESAVRSEVMQGVAENVEAVLPREAWSAEQASFRSSVRAAATPRMCDEAFEACYRHFALGKVQLKDRDYRIHDLTAGRSSAEVWSASDDATRIVPRAVSGRDIAIVHYDFRRGDEVEISGTFDLPVPWEDFNALSVSFRRDQTWHELRVYLEIDGALYRSRSVRYLGEDDYWEATFRLPDAEFDARLGAKHYSLLDVVDRGSAYAHGSRRLRVRVVVSRNSLAGACRAKAAENYRRAFAEVPFIRYLTTSVFLAIANIIGTCLTCSMAAFALARLRWPGRDLAFILVLATLMIPPQVTMIPSFVIYRSLGWYNTLLPLWAPSCFAVNAFAIFLLRQAMKGLPRDLEDAAKIDGCGFFRIYWHVCLPLMKPTLAAISVFTFLYVWNDFMGPLIYVNDQRLYPAALGLFSFMAGRESMFTLVMAASVVMTLPVIAIFFALQRFFIQGVALSGIKG